nr:hypothetical protein [uncultured Chryseobacterium sp.]
MKYLILILSIILFISCKSTNIQKEEYRVYKIEKLNSYYIIYCEKDGQKYKIVSKESIDKTSNNKVKIGKIYSFILHQYPIKNMIDNNPLTNTTTTPYVIHCYMFDETKVCEEEFIKLYTADNLKGLYYIKK